MRSIRTLMAPFALVAALLVAAPAAHASPSDGAVQRMVSGAASALFTAAWPTADYDDYRLQSIRPRHYGADVHVRLLGRSGLEGRIWFEMVVEVNDDLSIRDLHVGDYDAFLPPFTVAALTVAVIDELNR